MLAWTSLSTSNGSGNPAEENVFEIGIYITEEEPPFGMLGAVGYPIQQMWPMSEIVRDMNPYVYKQLTESGLIDTLMTHTLPDQQSVEEEVIELIGRFGSPGDYVMAGRCTQKLREWLRWHFPDLYKWYGSHDLDLNGFYQVVKYLGVDDEYKYNESELPGRAMKDAEFYFLEFAHITEKLQQR